MGVMAGLGTVVVLNGAPRSGKSSIATAMQDRFDGLWVNLGVDAWAAVTPPRYRPGIGLRPGGERPDVEAVVPLLYAGLYESVAAHSRLGVHVVVDAGHHEAYGRAHHTLADAARRLAGLPAWLVGVRCPLGTIMSRRDAAPDGFLTTTAVGGVPEPVRRWQDEVHRPGIYDLEVDTSTQTPAECAHAIATLLRSSTPRAFRRLARSG
jgi:chloramphenicol 3-O phosphotransferase